MSYQYSAKGTVRILHIKITSFDPGQDSLDLGEIPGKFPKMLNGSHFLKNTLLPLE